jgi:hypothetical protein
MKGTFIMPIVLGIALGMVVAAPLLGRWRAKIWLKKNALAEREITGFRRPELIQPIAGNFGGPRRVRALREQRSRDRAL